jgi:hypothetical protein
MPPRIRSLLPRLPFAREAKAPATEAPKVFREFVETLQKLDSAQPQPREKRAPRSPLRKRRYLGNGHKRPSPLRSRSRTR